MKKTKKCLLSLLTVTAMFSSLALFASCDEEHEHSYESTVTKAATCTEDGVMTYTCTECDDTYTEVISATGHSYTETVVEPTCTEQGYTEYVCYACGDSYKDNYMDAMGHIYENGVCTVCGFELNPSEGLAYTLSDDQQSYIVTGIGNCIDTDIVIPSTYNDLSVTAIGDSAFYYCTSLTSVTIPDSVTKIGEDAFCYCYNLTSVTIGNGVTSIGNYAFYQCYSLTSITIPNSVTSIGRWAFYSCTDLTSVTIGSGVTSIEDATFYNCSNLTNITIPASVTNIGSYVFESCTSLTSITVSADNAYYKSIDGNLYSKDGTELIQYAIGKTATSFVIPNGVTYIGSYAFAYCNNLTSITISDGVTSIGGSAFSGCSNLTSITIPDGVTSIGSYAFNDCSGLTSITIPDSVTSFGENMFSGCFDLTNIAIGNGITSIEGKYAFCDTAYYNNASNWKDGVLYLTATDEMTKYLLAAKTSISGDYTVEDGTRVIAEYAFYDCGNLMSITVPDSVVSIGYATFSGCSSLTSMTLPFVGGSINPNVNSNLISFGHIFGCDSYSGGIDVGQSYYSSQSATVTAIVAVSYCIPASLTSVTITGGDIHQFSFEDCTNLVNVTLGDGVTSIGALAFYDCDNLTSVTFEDPDNWYVSYEEQIDVSDPYTAATYLTNDYCGRYWYKA